MRGLRSQVAFRSAGHETVKSPRLEYRLGLGVFLFFCARCSFYHHSDSHSNVVNPQHGSRSRPAPSLMRR